MWGRKLQWFSSVEGGSLVMFFCCQCKCHTFDFIQFQCKTVDCCQPGELDRKPQRSAVLLAWKPQSKALLFQGLAKLWGFDVETPWAGRTQNGIFQLELLFSEEKERSTTFIVWDLALMWPAENISAGAWPPARSYPHQPYHHLPGQGTAVNTWGWMYLQRPVLALELVDQLCGYVHRGSLQPVRAAVPHQLSLCLWVSGWRVCGSVLFSLSAGFLGIFCFTDLHLPFSVAPTFEFGSSFVWNQWGISVFSQTLFKPNWTHPCLCGELLVFPNLFKVILNNTSTGTVCFSPWLIY